MQHIHRDKGAGGAWRQAWRQTHHLWARLEARLAVKHDRLFETIEDSPLAQTVDSCGAYDSLSLE